MAKQRKGEKASDAGRESRSEQSGAESVITEQVVLGNAVLQGRMEGTEAPVIADRPGLELVAGVASPLIERAIAALNLDATDPERLARRVEILENSRLSEKDALIDQLHGDEASRATRDALVERHFGAVDRDTVRAIDATLDAVRAALAQGAPSDKGWADALGEVEVVDAEGSLDVRASGLIAAIADARASEAAQGAATDAVGRSTASLARSLALMILLDEEEDEEVIVDDGWEVGTV